MKADTQARSINYKEMCKDLINGEYDSFTSFMEEVRRLVRHHDLTNRHHGLLMDKAKKHFGIE